MTTVLLPQSFMMNAISKFTSNIVMNNGRPVSNEIVLDFSKLNFIDGSGYTVLSNAVEWLISKNVKVIFINFDNKANLAIQYLDDCGFFKTYAGYPLRMDAKVRETTLPCRHIEHQHGFGWIEKSLSPWIEFYFDCTYAQVASIRTCVKEVLNNISDHASVNTGFVHAQYYPAMKTITITMSDFGTGIPNTIRKKFGPMNDGEAIIHATKDGVTAKSQPNNMGAGLSYLVDAVLGNHGIVRFHSLGGNLTCEKDNRGKRSLKTRSGCGHYPGTLIELEFDTRLFVGDEDDGRVDFEW